jgi:hypothetical protein
MKKTSIILFFIFMSFSSIGAVGTQNLDFGKYKGRIHSDGSGSIGTSENLKGFKDIWSVRIKKDEMTDEKIITVRRDAYKSGFRLRSDISLFLELSNKENEYLCISGHNYPNKKGIIRVDKNQPIETNVNGCVKLSTDLDSQMRKGNNITLRGYNWPYDAGETQNISLGGYISVSEYLRSRR